jgi:hypothetical protein
MRATGADRHSITTRRGLHSRQRSLQDMHMRRIFVTDEAKKKLLRPCREARALGL